MCQERFWRRCVKSAKWAVPAVLVCALVFLVAPQRETAEPVIKIGFVDMTKLFREYHRTKTVSAEFEAKFNTEQEELERRAALARQLNEELQEKGPTISEEERRNLEDRYREELANVREYRNRTAERLRRDKERAERQLLEDLQKAVNEYGTREGYSIILSKSQLLHGAQSFDLTDEILKVVDSQ